MNKIQLLPIHLVDQIKAGEVIERPSALLKEVIENSLDAESSKISIQIQNNGLDLVSVEDNGKGIEFHDLPLAFLRHATSKILHFEDLYNLNSFGFRGEALASIASISRITCTSIPDMNEGGKITLEGGKQTLLIPFKQGPRGTSLYVRDLFYNTPARLKFLKSQLAEKKAIKKILDGFLLTYPKVEFEITIDQTQKQLYKSLPSNDIYPRLKNLWFKNPTIKDEILKFEGEYDHHKIILYSASGTGKNYHSKQQFIFANKRMINHKAFHHLINKSLEKILGPSTQGNYCLFIDVPPEQIDVNVHPNKIEVKFLNESIIYSLIKGGIDKMIQPLLANPSIDAPKNIISKQNYENSFEHLQFQEDDNIASSQFFDLGETLALFSLKGDETKYLISKKRLFLDFIQSFYKKNYPIRDELILPLIITTPVSMEINSHEAFPFFEKMGFGLEKLEDNTIVLKSIPLIFARINYKPILNFIFKSSDFSQFIKLLNSKIIEKELIVSNYDLLIILKGEENLFQYPSIKIITEDFFLKKERFLGK